jgi:exopolysaccharide biosynthesis WecB/TagA/CpsF family protein
LTANLFARVIAPADPIVLIGTNNEQARALAERYGLTALRHFNPPMGFIRDPRAVDECVRFIESHSPFRFCFLAVGAPQQEALAQILKSRGIARGMAFCIGASVNFLTGVERRAPLWLQHLGVEWLFRLAMDPGRLAKRYLVRGPRVFLLLPLTDIRVRRRATLHAPGAVTVGSP